MRDRLSVVAFAAMVAGIVGLFYSGALFQRTPSVIALQVMAALLMVWARLTFGRRSFHPSATPTAGGLVMTGPYRYLRHPIYTAALLFAWPGALIQRSPASIGFAALVSAGAVIRMLCEESLLVRQYPDYVEYASTTKRMIPYVF
ncbi:MAG TPA: isoprenylcysteine carboxylmethyltransferase family protein [Vicinamibacterales bacterium]|jgi:protein-S-isoprenylcysteine O-methyltransferase Ste14